MSADVSGSDARGSDASGSDARGSDTSGDEIRLQVMEIDMSGSSIPTSSPVTNGPPITPKYASPTIPTTLSPPTDAYGTTPVPNKVSYRTVETIVRGLYNDTNTTKSTALDILAIYLKGQKILYTEAKVLCEMRLIALMLPAILVSCLSTLLSLQLKNYEWGGTVVSSLSAFNAFILAIVSFLKLDAKAESHKISAYKYDKLQSFCEFKSGKILFLTDTKDEVETIIDSVETQVKEIKETNQFIIPEYIRHYFHQTYAVNVFSRVKEIQTREMMLINDLKSLINEILLKSAVPIKTAEEARELARLNHEQNNQINMILSKRKELLDIDQEFEEEIIKSIDAVKMHRFNCFLCFNCFSWFNT